MLSDGSLKDNIKEYSSTMMEAFCVLVVTAYRTVAAIAKLKEQLSEEWEDILIFDLGKSKGHSMFLCLILRSTRLVNIYPSGR